MAISVEANPYATAADLYWSAGWHGILPLPPSAKKQPPSGWTGAAGRYPSYADVATWIEDKPAGSNIALRMPPNVIGLDVDDYGDKRGGKTLTLAETMHGALPPTWRSTSRNDGVSGIRFYRVPEGLAWPGEIGPATEIIQRSHRYAVVWPSVHPEGGTYRWINPEGVVTTTVPDPDDLAALPQAWVEAYTGGNEAETVKRHDTDYQAAMAWYAANEKARAEPCARMTRVIDDSGIGEGSAHNPARDFALRVARLTDEQHYGGVAALIAGRKRFITEATSPARALTGANHRTADEAAYEWSQLVASAVGLVTANPTGLDACDCWGQQTDAIVGDSEFGDKGDGAAPEDPDDPLAVMRAHLSDGEEFLLHVPDAVPTIWGDADDALWVEGEALMIAGPPGVGKTTLTGQILRGLLGLQERVLDLPVAPAKKVLYLAMDRPQQIRRALGRAFRPSEAAVLRERVEFWSGPPPGDFAKHPDLLVTLAQLAGASHVVIDSLKDAAIGLSEDDVGAAYNRARQKALAAGVQVLELHHMVKRGVGGAKPTELSDVYGSMHLTAGAGSVALLWGAAGDPIIEFRHLKQPVGEVGPYRLQHDHDAGQTTIFHGTDVLQIVAGSGPSGVTAKAIASQMFETDKPSSAQREKARRKLERLVQQGHVEAFNVANRNPQGGGRDEVRYRASLSTNEPVDNPVDDESRTNHDTQLYPPITNPITPITQAGPGPAIAANSPITPNHGTNHAGPNHESSRPLRDGGMRDPAADLPETTLEMAACNECGNDYLVEVIETGQGYCPTCIRDNR